jgi:hypothetical protein
MSLVPAKKFGLPANALDQHADRAFIKTGISVAMNDPGSVLTQQALQDEKITVFYEPSPTGKIGGYTEYDNANIVISEKGKSPWAPFTIADYLDLMERRLQKRIAEHEKQKASPPKPIDEAKLQQTYETFKKSNPKLAEDFKKNTDRMLQEQGVTQAQWKKSMAEADANFKKESADLQALRASFSPPQLASQASAGSGPLGLAKAGSPNARPLVKENPGFDWDKTHNGRIQLIVVSSSIKRTDPATPVNKIVRRSIETLDYATLAGLLH